MGVAEWMVCLGFGSWFGVELGEEGNGVLGLMVWLFFVSPVGIGGWNVKVFGLKRRGNGSSLGWWIC